MLHVAGLGSRRVHTSRHGLQAAVHEGPRILLPLHTHHTHITQINTLADYGSGRAKGSCFSFRARPCSIINRERKRHVHNPTWGTVPEGSTYSHLDDVVLIALVPGVAQLPRAHAHGACACPVYPRALPLLASDLGDTAHDRDKSHLCNREPSIKRTVRT